MQHPAALVKSPSRRGSGKSVAAARERGQLTNSKAQAALIDPDKPLSEMQMAFVRFWATGETPLSASVKAGYNDGGSYAYRMIYMPNILRAYNAEKARYEAESSMTRKRVIDGLLEGIEMAKLMAEPSSMIVGWKTIGQMCGYFAPVEVKHTMTHEGKIIHERLDKLSDEQLIEYIAKQAEQMRQLAPPGEPNGDHVPDGGETP